MLDIILLKFEKYAKNRASVRLSRIAFGELVQIIDFVHKHSWREDEKLKVICVSALENFPRARTHIHTCTRVKRRNEVSMLQVSHRVTIVRARHHKCTIHTSNTRYNKYRGNMNLTKYSPQRIRRVMLQTVAIKANCVPLIF